MRTIKWAILVCLMGFFSSIQAQAQDSIRFSLLTCEPGEEIYSLFGHTALHYQNFTEQKDLVFNYGMFSFRTPNFIYRFVKGETDYQLGITPYRYFEAEYALRGSSVYEQELNLTAEEKKNLLNRLTENYLPENRVYRYNYFYDNCTTRARDQVEQSIHGKVVYPGETVPRSFRSIIHEFTSNAPWDQFGIDLCLGAEADKPIDKRLQQFAPFYMRDFASQAYIVNEAGVRRPLVKQETKIIEAEPAAVRPASPLSPMNAAALFLALNGLVAWLQWRKKTIFWGWDLLLYGLQGLAGCIIAFLFFLSVHPTVGSNWMLLLLNPVPLVYLPVMTYRSIKGQRDRYHLINLVYLTLFIVIFPFSPQEFNLTVLPLALGLLVNAASHVLVWNKKA